MPHMHWNARRNLALLLCATGTLGWLAGCPNAPVPVEPNGGTDVDSQTGQTIPEPIALSVKTQGPGTVTQEALGPMITLTAEPETDWAFSRWTGSTFSRRNPLTILPSEATDLTAHFVVVAFDADFDGVTDDDDLCANTPFDEVVDATNGCSCTQLDDDNDLVDNCADHCPGTPTDEPSNALGCSCSQLDDDRDGVPNCDDECRFTVFGSVLVNDAGCGPQERDTDDDGVRDYVDDCPDSPAGDLVNRHGCPPVCGNDDVEPGEECDPPDGVNCTSACKIIPPVCGNSILEAGEQCEPPNTATCDADCQAIRTPVCGDGIVNGDEECEPPNTFTCSAACRTVTVPVCGNGIVEQGEQCDPPNGVTCDFSCRTIVAEDCGNGTIEGNEECEPPNTDTCDANCRIVGVCTAGAGPCDQPNNTPGCEDRECCETICDCFPECCTGPWTQNCVVGTAFVCIGVPSVCGPGAGDCLSSHGGRGCEEELCCEAVCVADPSCCAVGWSSQCVDIAREVRQGSALCVCGQ